MAVGSESFVAIDLRAVILVARLQPGPRLIFHYPPNPRRTSSRGTKEHSDSGSGADSDDDERARQLNSANNPNNGNEPVQGEGLSQRSDQTSKDTGLSTHSLFGYSEETLQKLLSPGCWSDRKRFEICLDGLTFLGHPTWAAQDGSWNRKHSHDDDVSRQQASPSAKPHNKPQPTSPTGTSVNIVAKAEVSRPTSDFAHAPDSIDSHAAGQSFATSMASESSQPGAAATEKLSMFNIVFVVGSPKSRDHYRQVEELYQHIAKVLSKALHYCQRQTQYLGLQTKKLLSAKAKARQDGVSEAAMCERMIETSEIAWCMKEIYEKIKGGEIAGIRINGVEMALQIPSTAVSSQDQGRKLDPHAGLLLLESKEALLRELTHPDASTLAYFIREHTPTKSLQKLATRLGIPLEEILNLARHLIKWRKARAVDPLHPRNTYVVCKDAPLGEVRSHYADDYAKRFPVLPSLTQMLGFLSGKPVRYRMLIPSREHRNPYMQILAYLVQHHLVEQLKTYGWLQAPMTPVSRVRKVEEVNENRRPLSVASLLSPQMRPVRDEDTISVSSERTAIPVSVMETRQRKFDFTSFPRSDTAHENGDSEPPQIVIDPLTPSTEDEQRLRHISDTVEDDELREHFPSLLRYFDGTYAFEEIAAYEGLKRAKVEAWFDALQKDGFLVTFRAA